MGAVGRSGLCNRTRTACETTTSGCVFLNSVISLQLTCFFFFIKTFNLFLFNKLEYSGKKNKYFSDYLAWMCFCFAAHLHKNHL